MDKLAFNLAGFLTEVDPAHWDFVTGIHESLLAEGYKVKHLFDSMPQIPLLRRGGAVR